MRFLGLTAGFLLLGTLLSAQQASQIAGEYIEGRSNRVYGCYCEWSGEGVTSGQEAIVAWNIRAGEFRGVPLAGVKVAAVLVAESTLSKGSPPRKSILFLDSAASKAQQQAVESLLRQHYAELLGEVVNLHVVPMKFEMEAGKAALQVGQLLNLTMRKAVLPDDALQGSTLWYDPFIPLTESTIATTLNNRYWGGDFKNRWEHSEAGTNGYYGRFELALR